MRLIGYDLRNAKYVRNDIVRRLDKSFLVKDWLAVFVDILKFSPDKRDPQPRDAREKYPMLCRIVNLTDDYTYDPFEVTILKKECKLISTYTVSSSAQAGLDKLIDACNEAGNTGYGLLLAGK